MVPASHRKAWLAADLDWKSVENHAVLKGYISGESVSDIVDDVNFVEATEFLDISWNGDEMRLSSFQSQAGFTESMVGFAAAWAAAAAFEGVGELVGFGMGARFGYLVRVEKGRASVVKFADADLDEIAKLEQHPRRRRAARAHDGDGRHDGGEARRGDEGRATASQACGTTRGSTGAAAQAGEDVFGEEEGREEELISSRSRAARRRPYTTRSLPARCPQTPRTTVRAR